MLTNEAETGDVVIVYLKNQKTLVGILKSKTDDVIGITTQEAKKTRLLINSKEIKKVERV